MMIVINRWLKSVRSILRYGILRHPLDKTLICMGNAMIKILNIYC